jgi:hypothetical protein
MPVNDYDLISALDPAAFARTRLGFHPDLRKTLILRSDARRGPLNCTRQWGKSTVTAAKAVHHAWTVPESLVRAVCPTARQSGEFVQRRRLPPQTRRPPQRRRPQ